MFTIITQVIDSNDLDTRTQTLTIETQVQDIPVDPDAHAEVLRAEADRAKHVFRAMYPTNRNCPLITPVRVTVKPTPTR